MAIGQPWQKRVPGRAGCFGTCQGAPVLMPGDEAEAGERETGCGASCSHWLRLHCAPQNLTYEIILTLGQAFEVAYQLALQAQKSRPLGASAADTVETKSSKPVPKPRVATRKSTVREPGVQGQGAGGPSTRWNPPTLQALAPRDRPCSVAASQWGTASLAAGAPRNAALCLCALLCAPGAAPRSSLLPLSHVHHPPSFLPAAAVC